MTLAAPVALAGPLVLLVPVGGLPVGSMGVREKVDR